MKFAKRPKIILVPYPAQGHVTPMLKLASAFKTHELDPVLVIPEHIQHQIATQIEAKDGILCMSIPDGLDKDMARDFFAIENAMENNMPSHLEKLIGQLSNGGEEEDDDGGGHVVCLVVDLLASWAIEVGKRCGLPVAGFWPAMFASYRLISSIPDLVRNGLISDTGLPQHIGSVCCLPSQHNLSTEELPWLIGTPSARRARFKFWNKTLARSTSLQWILVNSFLDETPTKNPDPKLFTISQNHHYPLFFPIIPLSNSTITKNPSFWEEDKSCLDWLDKHNPNSVVYISFGSWVSPIGESKVKSLAIALESSKMSFIWVLKSTWCQGLPKGYIERVSRQGKIVSWAPQMDILRHQAIGCYLTHCGWNSTMEAIQSRKRLLCYPVAGDQFLNCNFIVEVWKIGIRLNGFGQKDVEDGLRTVMGDGDMNSRIVKLYEKSMGQEAKSTVDYNLTTFIDNLRKLTFEPPIIRFS